MVKKSGKLDRTGEGKETNTKGKVNNEIDALFKLPLAEFTGARNTLAAQLKKGGRGGVGGEADLVKALVKPSISAWAVNQLYWNHREAFDRLLESSGRFQKAQSSRHAGKLADMRGALDARRKALSQLSDLATSLLRDAGHNPTLDTGRRITNTLEAMSVYPSSSDAPRPGRLTHDVDPPGFEALGLSSPGSRKTEPAKESARFTPSQKSSSAATNTGRKVAPDKHVRQLEEKRKAGIAAAKASLQDAKKELIDARARAQSLQAAQKKADAKAKAAEKQRRQTEERLEKARAASEAAVERAQSVAAEVEEAAQSVEDAKRAIEKASEELDKLSRESSAR